jgi:hypothetical protein
MTNACDENRPHLGTIAVKVSHGIGSGTQHRRQCRSGSRPQAMSAAWEFQ